MCDFVIYFLVLLNVLPLTHTSGSTLSGTPSVIELITFAALYWGSTMATPVLTWFLVDG